MDTIVTRHEWKAAGGLGGLDPGPEKNVVIHNSHKPALTDRATLTDEIKAWRGIESYHVDHNKWKGIGYNFGASPTGRILEGRGWKYRGSHAGPINGDSIGICLLIDGQTTEPTAKMIGAVRDLIRVGIELGEIASDYKISGHRDWMKRTCPGDKVYARLAEFRHDYAEPALAVPPGTRRWSDYFKQHVVVVRFISDTEWLFVTEENLEAMVLNVQRGQVPFSTMPNARW